MSEQKNGKSQLNKVPFGTRVRPYLIVAPSLIITIGLNLLLDTLWLKILMGQGFFALLPTRILKCAVMLPIQVILIPVVWNTVFKKIRSGN